MSASPERSAPRASGRSSKSSSGGASKGHLVPVSDQNTQVEPHKVLYRRFRPNTFGSVIGQDHITGPLRAAVMANKVPHAMLLSGVRGSGKTTTARILAMVLNCTTVVDGEPCLECEYCLAVLNGTHGLGVTEVDCATYRGINDMREVIASMNLSTIAKHNVYILDECHRLTAEAATALLKPVEDSPPGVTIIFATTDPEKVNEALRSRLTPYKFRTLDTATMTGLVKGVAERAGIALDDDEAASVVMAGRGSPRDALSALELVSSGGELVTTSYVESISAAVADGSVSEVLTNIAKALTSGADPAVLTSNLVTFWRDCLLAANAPQLLNVSGDRLAELTDASKALGARQLVSLLRSLADAGGRMHLSGDPRLLLETTVLQVMVPENRSDVDGLYDLIEDLRDDLAAVRKDISRIGTAPASADDDWPPLPEKAASRADAEAAPVEDPDLADDDHEDSSDDHQDETQEDDRDADQDSPDDDPEPPVQSRRAKNDRSAEDVLDSIAENASRRLRTFLNDAGALFSKKSGRLEVEGPRDISDELYDELEELAEAEGHKVVFFTIDDQ